MATVRVGTEVRAPLSEVFAVFSDIEGAASRVRNIRRIEMLTPGGVKIGTRWRETREFVGREASEELQITAYELNRTYTITCDSHGTRFDVTFNFAPGAGGTDVTAELDIVPQSFGAKLTAPFGAMLVSTIHKALEEDLRDIKHAIEGTAVKKA